MTGYWRNFFSFLVLFCTVAMLFIFRPSTVQAFDNTQSSIVPKKGLTSLLELSALTQLTQLTPSDYEWIGSKIYQNECASNPKYLTYWGEGESFPSFGIGHFIWHAKGQGAKQSFIETFPDMVRFVSKTSVLPNWLDKRLKEPDSTAPWQSKLSFDQAWSNESLVALRLWLLNTQPQQAAYIVSAFKARWLQALASLEIEEQRVLNQKLSVMMRTKRGVFAVIDYFNFKGIGLNATEQYQGQSWGLASVLSNIPVLEGLNENERMRLFKGSAKSRLKLRTALAPQSRNEQRWLKGWFSRIEQY